MSTGYDMRHELTQQRARADQLQAERDALAAHCERLREALHRASTDCLQSVNCVCASCKMTKETPATSLALRDRAVERRVWEEAARLEWMCEAWKPHQCSVGCYRDALRARAQASEKEG